MVGPNPNVESLEERWRRFTSPDLVEGETGNPIHHYVSPALEQLMEALVMKVKKIMAEGTKPEGLALEGEIRQGEGTGKVQGVAITDECHFLDLGNLLLSEGGAVLKAGLLNARFSEINLQESDNLAESLGEVVRQKLEEKRLPVFIYLGFLADYLTIGEVYGLFQVLSSLSKPGEGLVLVQSVEKKQLLSRHWMDLGTWEKGTLHSRTLFPELFPMRMFFPERLHLTGGRELVFYDFGKNQGLYRDYFEVPTWKSPLLPYLVSKPRNHGDGSLEVEVEGSRRLGEEESREGGEGEVGAPPLSRGPTGEREPKSLEECGISSCVPGRAETWPTVMIALLLKNSEKYLRAFLDCLLALVYPKERIFLYVRTNDNEDSTPELVQTFLEEHAHEYMGIYFDGSSIKDQLKSVKQHDWFPERFQVLGKIRDDSIRYAEKLGVDYYLVVDHDNFLAPTWLRHAVVLKKDVLAPLLSNACAYRTSYSNHFGAVNPFGFFQSSPEDMPVLCRTKRGIFEKPVVHCTYLIHKSCLDRITYLTEKMEQMTYEFVVFSNNNRARQVKQWIDNRNFWGTLVLSDDPMPSFIDSSFLHAYQMYWNYQSNLELFAKIRQHNEHTLEAWNSGQLDTTLGGSVPFLVPPPLTTFFLNSPIPLCDLGFMALS